jgi:hypothetical protein
MSSAPVASHAPEAEPAFVAGGHSQAAVKHAISAWRWVGPVRMASNAIPNGHLESAGGWVSRAALVAAWLLQCCGCVRVAAKAMASGDLGSLRPGGMTVPDRLAGICPDRLPHIAGAGRWPSPDPACVIWRGLLPVLVPERAGARRSALGARRSALGARRSALGARRSALGAREILFFDGPADAAQMPPESV